MKKRIIVAVAAAAALLLPSQASAQYAQDPPETTDSSVVLTLDDALRIALSENVSVKVADKEIERLTYAKKGTYASLFPQINASGSYQRTIKKQVMYMGGGDDEEGKDLQRSPDPNHLQ